MTRVTVPSTHVALILPRQLAEELQTLSLTERKRLLSVHRRNIDTAPERAAEAKTLAAIHGDFLLALLEGTQL